MKLTLDNLDGLGAVDYTAVLTPGTRIVRTLNAPTAFEATVCLAGSSLKMPVRQARVLAANDAGVTLFTGYLTTEPVAIYAGVASEGAVYRLALRALSDEWLLDRVSGLPRAGEGFAAGGAALLGTLAGRYGGALAVPGSRAPGRAVGVFTPDPAAPWSANAGALAGSVYGGYRALGGSLTLEPAGAVVHLFSEADGSRRLADLRTSAARELANDVTVSGELEPDTFWTELFAGDGVPAAFELTGDPGAVNAGHAELIHDRFELAAIDTRTWTLQDGGTHLAPGAGGLVMNGGNGLDGQVKLTAIDAIELGGTVVAELDGVVLASASAGILSGFYSGTVTQANCVAGFNVRQSGGNTIVTPMVNGLESGASLTVSTAGRYTLRIRLHSPELVRVKQTYYARVEANGLLAVQSFGGGLVDSPLAVVFEVREEGASSNTPVTVLFDGSIASSAASCTFALVNCLQLFGSVGACGVTRTGTGWVRSTASQTGTEETRLVGRAGQGVDATLSSSSGTNATGKVTFFAGRIPAVGETIAVSYRGRRRAIARMANTASIAAESAGGGHGTARWLGRVVRPRARTSEDCENAANAILGFAADRAAAAAGTWTATNPQGNAGEVWPGDVLSFTMADGNALNVLVRGVTIEDGNAAPELLRYRITFANDWAEGLGLHLSDAVAKDTPLPPEAIDSAMPAAARFCASLPQMSVQGTSGHGTSFALNVDAGTGAPAGGGFEVRRRDEGFGSGPGDLVLRSPVRVFQIPLSEVGETFFIRMYDGSTPPLYSRVSSAIVAHLPVV